jgi:hypothetical protein
MHNNIPLLCSQNFFLLNVLFEVYPNSFTTNFLIASNSFYIISL